MVISTGGKIERERGDMLILLLGLGEIGWIDGGDYELVERVI